MGTLHYGTDVHASIDDTTLAHLAAITIAKLRRDEPFLVSYLTNEGRDSLWIHRSSVLRWSYDTPAAIDLDRARLESMVRDTNRPSGLNVTIQQPAVLAAVEAAPVAAQEGSAPRSTTSVRTLPWCA